MGKVHGKQGKEAVKGNPKGTGIIRNKKGQFIKGVSGNLNGKPPGTVDLVRLMKEELKRVDPKSKKTYAQLLIRRITTDAIAKGDPQQIKNLLQYTAGMPKQEIAQTGDINLNLIHYGDRKQLEEDKPKLIE